MSTVVAWGGSVRVGLDRRGSGLVEDAMRSIRVHWLGTSWGPELLRQRTPAAYRQSVVVNHLCLFWGGFAQWVCRSHAERSVPGMHWGEWVPCLLIFVFRCVKRGNLVMCLGVVHGPPDACMSSVRAFDCWCLHLTTPCCLLHVLHIIRLILLVRNNTMISLFLVPNTRSI